MANKRARVACEVTTGRPVVDLKAGMSPVMADDEAAAAHPPLLQIRRAQRQRVAARDSGGCVGVWRGG
jgi:hypothetical protein